jgi:hypothetical protein
VNTYYKYWVIRDAFEEAYDRTVREAISRMTSKLYGEAYDLPTGMEVWRQISAENKR